MGVRTILIIPALFLMHLVHCQDISDSIGIITLNEKYGEDDWIEILNEDGSIWYRFSFYKRSDHLQWKEESAQFKPFKFDRNYFLLKIRCSSKKRGRYKVLINEVTGLTKYIRTQPFLILESWEDYVLEAFSVDFNQEQNPILHVPEGTRMPDEGINEETVFKPLSIKGDWLQVQWSADEFPDENSQFSKGWIRWKQNDRIIVEIYFFA